MKKQNQKEKELCVSEHENDLGQVAESVEQETPDHSYQAAMKEDKANSSWKGASRKLSSSRIYCGVNGPILKILKNEPPERWRNTESLPTNP